MVDEGAASLDFTVSGVFVDSVADLDEPCSVCDFDVCVEPLLDPPLDDVRLSVMYHPDPLNTTPTFWMTRWTSPPHDAHTVSGSSLNF